MEAKIKTNAVDIYMVSNEFKKGIFSQNLNLKDEIKSKIDFLENNLGKNIIIKNFDRENMIVTFSRFENSKNYDFPFDIIEESEEEFEEEITEEKKDLRLDKKIIIICLTIILIIFGYILNGYTKADYKQEVSEVSKVSEIDIKYQEINKINLEVSTELEKQNQYRKMKDDLDKKINESIKQVTEKEKKLNDLRIESINLSNKI